MEFHKSQRDKATNREDWNKHNQNHKISQAAYNHHSSMSNHISNQISSIHKSLERAENRYKHRISER